MTLEIKKLLQDISDSIAAIESHLQNAPTLEAYVSNTLVSDAVVRRLSIIGEALWKANKMDSELMISGKRKIIALRHIIVHDYDVVEPGTIWIICRKHLPVLKSEVQSLLNT